MDPLWSSCSGLKRKSVSLGGESQVPQLHRTIAQLSKKKRRFEVIVIEKCKEVQIITEFSSFYRVP